MRYKTINDLPATIRDMLPEEAQKIYLEAYNKAWDSYDEESVLGQQGREATAHRDGWNAVKLEYVHDEEKGIWYPKGEAPEERDEDQGLVDKLKDVV